VDLQLTVADLEVEPKFVNACDRGATVWEALGNDQSCRETGQHFVAAVMHTNPLDALYELSLVIRGIETRASQCGAESMIPFEVTFGLYLAVMTISDVPNFEELAAFVADFAPVEGLCSAFEFAAVTTEAARKYCSSLRDGNL
jgi:hypothetical protein